MSPDIKIAPVENELDVIHWKLDEFADSIGEKVTRLFPIWACLIDGKLLGWFHTHPQLIIYPTIDPKISHKNFYFLANTFLPKFKALHGDPLVTANHGEFSEELLKKIHLEKFPYALYKVSSD